MSLHHLAFIMALVLMQQRGSSKLGGPGFFENYKITWGNDHVRFSSQDRDVQLLLDQSSGSGFQSKLGYGSGFFHLNLKLTGSNSAGVVTAFYLVSNRTTNWDELDFEFLGNNQGKPFLMQTNVITNGKGDREQRLQLWFDPTASHHSYRILWNTNQIVFFIDNDPIRVFKNKQNIGVGYPSQQMYITASIWNGDDWATDGGQTKINWTYAPFTAGFRSFSIYGCSSQGSNMGACHSPRFWWNREKYRELSPEQEIAYEAVKRDHLTYDYCTDRQRFAVTPPECPQ